MVDFSEFYESMRKMMMQFSCSNTRRDVWMVNQGWITINPTLTLYNATNVQFYLYISFSKWCKNRIAIFIWASWDVQNILRGVFPRLKKDSNQIPTNMHYFQNMSVKSMSEEGNEWTIRVRQTTKPMKQQSWVFNMKNVVPLTTRTMDSSTWPAWLEAEQVYVPEWEWVTRGTIRMPMAGVGEDTDTDGSVMMMPSLSHVSNGGGDDWAMQDCWKVSPSKTSMASIRGIRRGRSASVKGVYCVPSYEWLH